MKEQNARLHVIIPADLKTQAQLRAVRENTTLTDVIVTLLRGWVDQPKTPKHTKTTK
jgi:hypothetical protein